MRCSLAHSSTPPKPAAPPEPLQPGFAYKFQAHKRRSVPDSLLRTTLLREEDAGVEQVAGVEGLLDCA